MRKIEQCRCNVLSDYNKMKVIAQEYYNSQQWDNSLRMIFIASGFMYTMNQVLYDDELEALLKNIAKQKVSAERMPFENINTILYYDSFGNFSRGLTRIYLEALVQLNYRVVYVTSEKFEDSVAEVQALLGKGNMRLVKGKTYFEQMGALANIIEELGAVTAFLYLTPDDVVATGVFACYDGIIKRYLINLTDHAFWLGKNASDVIICFREFGCKVAKEYRKIEQDKLVYIPYYPAEINVAFEGLPFENPDNPLIFSGGSLYKTYSQDNMYYRLVDEIMASHENINFIYYGNGDARKIKKIVKKYQDRVFFATERKDFYEIMKKCIFYLSTYPYNGGLMTQYALLAGKVPVTLCNHGIEKELSINYHQAYWNFDSVEECMKEIDKLINDEQYRKDKELGLKSFLIDSEQFKEELNYLLRNGQGMRCVIYDTAVMQGFQRIPIENIFGMNYCRLFFRKNGVIMLKYFPIKFVVGALSMLWERTYKK